MIDYKYCDVQFIHNKWYIVAPDQTIAYNKGFKNKSAASRTLNNFINV